MDTANPLQQSAKQRSAVERDAVECVTAVFSAAPPESTRGRHCSPPYTA